MDFGVFLALSAVLGVIFGRWPAVFVGAGLAALFYVGLLAEWWGSGLGDGWPVGVPFTIAVFMLSSGIGVGLRSVLRALRQPSISASERSSEGAGR